MSLTVWQWARLTPADSVPSDPDDLELRSQVVEGLFFLRGGLIDTELTDDISKDFLIGLYVGDLSTPGALLFVNVGGVWKSATMHVNVGGVWKTAAAHVNVAGTWET
jgi:hypothetical protein